MLHQILNRRQFSGAGGRVFERFIAEVVKPEITEYEDSMKLC